MEKLYGLTVVRRQNCLLIRSGNMENKIRLEPEGSEEFVTVDKTWAAKLNLGDYLK